MAGFGFDLINFLDACVGRAVHGATHRIVISTATEFSGIDAEATLRQYGVRIWGREICGNDEVALNVRATQAKWAEYLLSRRGIPIVSPVDPRHRRRTCLLTADRRTMPTPWQAGGVGPRSFVDGIVDLLGACAGKSARRVSGVSFSPKRRRS